MKIDADDIITIATRDKVISDSFGMLEVGPNLYMKDISLFQIDSIWEERSPTLKLPMPKGLKEKEIIK
ncbi:MAG: hypothetical protein ACEPOZ_11535 [Marinifilaceae bacterium]